MPGPRPARKPASRTSGRALWFETHLAAISRGVTLVKLRKSDLLYAKGRDADSVFFVKTGRVRRSVLSESRQEAVLGLLKPGDFCGEGCLSGQAVRVSTAAALTATTAIRVDKGELAKALHDNSAFSAAFLKHLLVHTVAVEKDLCGQLFNRIDKRLARALLRLSRCGQDAAGGDARLIPANMSQQALAEIIGVSRLRVSAIMSKFRRLRMVEYGGRLPKGEIRVHANLLLDVVLCE